MAVNITGRIKYLIPVTGILVFVFLYIIATFLYPGGSDHDKNAGGFSWLHNYWCELLASTAQNGRINTARPVALAGMFVLAITLSAFWYLYSLQFPLGNGLLVRYTGICSMLIAVFLFVGPHDLIMMASGLLGLLALFLVMMQLFRQRSYWLFLVGAFCIALCVLNNFIYYTGYWFEWLALIQKFTFIAFLYWFCAVSGYLFRRSAANGD